MKQELEIMRVLRVPPNGQLVVETRENRYEKITDLKNPKNRQLLLAAVGDLITFAGGYQALVDAGLAAPMGPQPKKSLEEQRADFLAKMENNTPPSPADVTSQVTTEDRSDLPVVDQIDAILQTHISSDPNLNGRSIHLIANPEGGINIKVDGQVYNHPKEINDKRIQLMIKHSIKEWESK